MGPELYVLYTSPLIDIISIHRLDFQFYADDSKLYLAFESTAEEELRALVQTETSEKKINYWMINSRLKLNSNKTELSIINAQNPRCPPEEYIEKCISRIQTTTSARNIGAAFDQHLSMDKHVTNICKNFFST